MKTLLMSAAGLIITLMTTSGLCRGDSGAIEEREAADNRFEHSGISIETSYTGEIWTNARGGYKKEHTHLHNIGIAATVDTKLAGLWDGGRFFAHVLSDQGGLLLTEDIVGDSQTVSNIEAPHSTRLYELWYEQMLFDGKLSLLLGLHDLNSEFAASEHGSLFINSSFGVSKEISGGARPSIFPLAAPAMRAKYAPDKSWEFMLGIYNGDPGDPGVHKHFPKFTFNGQAGAFIGFETAYRFGHETLPGTVRAGYWRNTGRFEDILNVDSAGNPITRKGNEGFYLIADKLIFASENNRCLGAFLQLGSAPGRSINEFKSYIGGGLKYSGLFPRRRNDEIGIAAAHARVNDRLVAGYGRDRSETTLEIAYRAAVHQHLSIQPDVQLVFNPGADSSVKNAVVAGLRFDISY